MVLVQVLLGDDCSAAAADRAHTDSSAVDTVTLLKFARHRTAFRHVRWRALRVTPSTVLSWTSRTARSVWTDCGTWQRLRAHAKSDLGRLDPVCTGSSGSRGPQQAFR